MQVALSFPTTDTGLLQWSQNVVDLITPVPATWGLVIGDVTSYTALHNAYSSALADCDPFVRNKTATVAKRDAMKALKTGAVTVANKIYATPTVTNAMKTQIGMPPRKFPSPIPAPITAPVLEIISATGWKVRIRLRDATGARRGKPTGCFGASVFSFIGATPPSNITDWTFEGSTGRVTKIDVTFPDTVAAGTKVWITAFWFNGRKQSGPICAPVSANLPGGSVATGT